MHYIRLFILLAIFISGAAPQSAAQTVIRDTEIETYMQGWFAPVFEAAEMDPEQVKIILVQDSDINAFVAGGANIFFFTGLLQKTETPGEVDRRDGARARPYRRGAPGPLPRGAGKCLL